MIKKKLGGGGESGQKNLMSERVNDLDRSGTLGVAQNPHQCKSQLLRCLVS